MICSIVITLHLSEEPITYSPPCLCGFNFCFLILVSQFFSFYVVSLEIFPNHVTNIPELVWILIFSGIFASASTVLINIDSIALGRLFTKMLKDLGDTPAELQAKWYSFWRWNHWITTFLSLDIHWISVSSQKPPSLPSFSFAVSQSLCVSLSLSLMVFFFSQLRTEDRNRKMPCEVWLLSVSHCLPESLLDPISPASLLCCYADTKCISFFSWGLVKCIFLLKNISIS